MKLDAYLYTNTGGRPDNEDSADYRVNGDVALFVLADGLGGHQDGAEASAAVVDALLSTWETASTMWKEGTNRLGLWLHERILAANEGLLERQQKQKNRLKSTVVALAIDGDQAAWSHVGDSRLYRLTGGHIYHATQDHSVTYKKFLAGEIPQTEINFDDDRSSLLRVVGDEARCLSEEGGGAVLPGDAFLLCSDGFWEYLYDEEILIDFLKAETPEKWAQLMLLRLLPRLRPDSDNLTLLTVFAT